MNVSPSANDEDCFDIDMTPCSRNCQTSSTFVKNRCCRYDMQRDSAMAWSHLHLGLFSNWSWQGSWGEFLSFLMVPYFSVKSKANIIPANCGAIVQSEERMAERSKNFGLPFARLFWPPENIQDRFLNLSQVKWHQPNISIPCLFENSHFVPSCCCNKETQVWQKHNSCCADNSMAAPWFSHPSRFASSPFESPAKSLCGAEVLLSLTITDV